MPIHKLKFIDLFAGIGGIRLAFEMLAGEVVKTLNEKPVREIPYSVQTSLDSYSWLQQC